MHLPQIETKPSFLEPGWWFQWNVDMTNKHGSLYSLYAHQLFLWGIYSWFPIPTWDKEELAIKMCSLLLWWPWLYKRAKKQNPSAAQVGMRKTFVPQSWQAAIRQHGIEPNSCSNSHTIMLENGFAVTGHALTPWAGWPACRLAADRVMLPRKCLDFHLEWYPAFINLRPLRPSAAK